jgi:hypothetical protein
MDFVKAMKLQSGDDERITINGADKNLDEPIGNYDIYWELRRTMQSAADIVISSLPSDERPEPLINVTIDPASVTINIPSDMTKLQYGNYFQYLYGIHKVSGRKESMLYGPILFMEGPDTIYPVTTYCTPEDVADQLMMLNPDSSRLVFTEQTTPARSTVIQWINEAESFIDRTTKNTWRENYVKDLFLDIKTPLMNMPKRDVAVSLPHSDIFPIDPDKGDKVLMWWGGSATDYALKPQQPNGRSWWVDYQLGILHFNDLWPWLNTGLNRLQVSYRWGNKEVPDDIRMVCTRIVAIRIMQSDLNKLFIMNTRPTLDWGQIIESWKEENKQAMNNHTRKIFSAHRR